MGTRFHGRGGPSRRFDDGDRTGDGFGEWWAAVAVLALAGLAIVSLAGSAAPRISSKSATPLSALPDIAAAIAPSERSLAEVEAAFATLCSDPVLLALELEPDCETGVMTLSDALFDGYGSSVLLPESREDLAAAMRIYLARLRDLPALWSTLESIEIRGHADPRATREPYTTNLVGSQQRPLGVLLFLAGAGGLGDRDREDLKRLAVVSGVSFSRPPVTCPEQRRECYAEWRRVEIRPVLSEALRRGDWSRTLEAVRLEAQRSEISRNEAAQRTQ